MSDSEVIRGKMMMQGNLEGSCIYVMGMGWICGLTRLGFGRGKSRLQSKLVERCITL